MRPDDVPVNDRVVVVVTTMRCAPRTSTRSSAASRCRRGWSRRRRRCSAVTLSTSRLKDFGKSERPAAVVAVALISHGRPAHDGARRRRHDGHRGLHVHDRDGHRGARRGDVEGREHHGVERERSAGSGAVEGERRDAAVRRTGAVLRLEQRGAVVERDLLRHVGDGRVGRRRHRDGDDADRPTRPTPAT